jgi:hypothetical protein
MEKRIKKTFICGNITDFNINKNLTTTHTPSVGDVAVFEVISIGKHTTMQGESVRNEKIMAGDQIMAAFGHRYATAQFEGYVPNKIQQEFHILGAGGVVGEVKTTNDKFKEGGPTKLRIIGYVTNTNNEVINTVKLYENQMMSFQRFKNFNTRVILSIGSSMDSGKTTTAAYLVHSLKKLGKKVAFIKLTGTAYTKDRDLAYDLGADVATDFSALGYPSTFMCSENELLDLYQTLMAEAMTANPDFVIMEIADGIFQRETKMLLQNQTFMNTIAEVVFSANDSLSAVCGVETLRNWGINPFALSGMFTTSPLLIEEVENLLDVPVYTLKGWERDGAMNMVVRTFNHPSKMLPMGEYIHEKLLKVA